MSNLKKKTHIGQVVSLPGSTVAPVHSLPTQGWQSSYFSPHLCHVRWGYVFDQLPCPPSKREAVKALEEGRTIKKKTWKDGEDASHRNTGGRGVVWFCGTAPGPQVVSATPHSSHSRPCFERWRNVYPLPRSEPSPYSIYNVPLWYRSPVFSYSAYVLMHLSIPEERHKYRLNVRETLWWHKTQKLSANSFISSFR